LPDKTFLYNLKSSILPTKFLAIVILLDELYVIVLALLFPILIFLIGLFLIGSVVRGAKTVVVREKAEFQRKTAKTPK